MLRLGLLGGRDLFRDEAASWLLASYPWPVMVPRMAAELYGPLYPFTLKAWMTLFGDGAAALRSLSGLAGLGVVAMTWAWSRQAIGRTGALVAALVVAVSPLALTESRLVRMYVLESFAATLAWWMLWRLLSGAHRSSRFPAIATAAIASLAVAAELWIMPTGLAIVGLQALLVAAVATWDRRRAVVGGAAVLIGVLLFVPWLPTMLGSASSERAFWTTPPTPGSVWTALTTLLAGWTGSPAVYAAPVLLVVAAAGLLALFRRPGRDARVTAVAVTAGASLVVAWWLVALLRSGYDVRYLGAALPMLAMAIGAGVAWLWAGAAPRVGRPLPAVALALLAAVFVSGTIAAGADWLGNRSVAPARATAGALERMVRPGDVVMVVDARSYFPMAYELGPASSDRSLAGRLWYWTSGSEPAYFGGGLIDPSRTIRARKADRGRDFAAPGLAPGGSVWVVALVNGGHELDGFTPLVDGRLQVADRVVVRGAGMDALVVRLRPAS